MLLNHLFYLEREILTWEATNDSNAYMLVYVRQDQASKLLKPIAEDDVPHGLIEEIEKNKKMDEERVNLNIEKLF